METLFQNKIKKGLRIYCSELPGFSYQYHQLINKIFEEIVTVTLLLNLDSSILLIFGVMI